MECVICGGDMKLIPAGISKKSGKKYSAFYSCGCGNTVNPEQELEKHETQMQQAVKAKVEAKQSDPYVEGKERNTRLMCRNDLMVELIRKWNDITMINDLKTLFRDLWQEIEK